MSHDPDRIATPAQIRVILNGETVEAIAENLQDLLDASGFAGEKVATALNGEFVPARTRPTQRLTDGDHIEVVSARQGG